MTETKAEREARHQADRGLNRRKFEKRIVDGKPVVVSVQFPKARRTNRAGLRKKLRARTWIRGGRRREEAGYKRRAERPDGTVFTKPPMAARKRKRRRK